MKPGDIIEFPPLPDIKKCGVRKPIPDFQQTSDKERVKFLKRISMGIIKKQFSTFTIEYVDMDITPDTYHKFSVCVENDNDGYGHIKPSEMTLQIATMLRSDDELIVRRAIQGVIDNRRYWTSRLESILK